MHTNGLKWKHLSWYDANGEKVLMVISDGEILDEFMNDITNVLLINNSFSIIVLN